MELSNKFLENMKELLKEDFDKYLSSFSMPAKKGFRFVNNYDSSFDLNLEKEKIEDIDNAFRLLSNEKQGNTLLHHLGLIYIQEPSSMLAAIILDVKNGEKVLDLCSAPGGKGTQILEKNKDGITILNEVNKKRANILLSNVERLGFKNAIILSATPESLSGVYENYFDKILVDAPCSGEGMFRKEPETISEWNEGLPKFNHERQMEILSFADKMLKNNGTLVYSTCTFNINENEQTVFEFKEKYGYEVEPLNDVAKRYTTHGFSYNGDKTLERTGRCFPQNDFGEGQFIAKLTKRNGNFDEFCEKRVKNNLKLPQNELKTAKSLVFECIKRENFNFYKIGNNVYITEKGIPPVVNPICVGVCLGTFSGERLIIHHQFIKAYGKEFINILNLERNDKRIDDFAMGNEIDCPFDSGYVSIVIDRAVLGGGKAVNHKLKNYYPKGLRAKLKDF